MYIFRNIKFILDNFKKSRILKVLENYSLQHMLRERRWCYDRSCFIRNNILTFIWLSCRNYYSICLNYTGYNFKQIDNKKTHL